MRVPVPVMCIAILTSTQVALAGGAAVTFGTPVFAPSGVTTPIGVGVGDLNLDGRADAAGLFFGLVVYHNDRGVLVPDDANPLPYMAPFEPTVRVADVSGDGLADIVVFATGGQNLTLFVRQSAGGYLEADTGIVSETYAPRFALGNFNGDGLPDIVAGSPFGVHVNLGGGAFAAVGNTALPLTNGAQVFAANMDGDGFDDVLTIRASETEPSMVLHVLRNLGAGELISAAQYELPSSVGAVESAVASDFNGDGLSDIAVVTHDATGNVAIIRLGQAPGTFGDAAEVPLAGIPAGIAAGDLNGDGATDLAVAVGSSPSLKVLVGAGDGTFASGGEASVMVTGGQGMVMDLAIADVSGDEQNEVVMAVIGHGLIVLPNTTPLPPASAADLNGDGVTGVADLLLLLASWGLSGVPADLDDDGVVGVTDLLVLLADWTG